ncbi:MAG: type II toxin-antitoxin system YafQ family toxin [Alphaproteobacteria bacterium]|nr:type II toxin-antitoxin system YafQ family toxin [Alphaproteobacteria bacterium]
MLEVATTGAFERDVKRAKKRGRNLDKLWRVVELLQRGIALEPRYRVHPLRGEWRHFLECHIEPDWLLIWRADGNTLFLTRTGTHADLFD